MLDTSAWLAQGDEIVDFVAQEMVGAAETDDLDALLQTWRWIRDCIRDRTA